MRLHHTHHTHHTHHMSWRHWPPAARGKNPAHAAALAHFRRAAENGGGGTHGPPPRGVHGGAPLALSMVDRFRDCLVHGASLWARGALVGRARNAWRLPARAVAARLSLAGLLGRCGDEDGKLRATCHFLAQLNHFIPGFRSYSVAVPRKRRSDLSPGELAQLRLVLEAEPGNLLAACSLGRPRQGHINQTRRT